MLRVSDWLRLLSPCKYVFIFVLLLPAKKFPCVSGTAYPIIKARHLIFPFTCPCLRQIARSISCPWRWALHSKYVYNFEFNLGPRLKFLAQTIYHNFPGKINKTKKMKTLATQQSWHAFIGKGPFLPSAVEDKLQVKCKFLHTWANLYLYYRYLLFFIFHPQTRRHFPYQQTEKMCLCYKYVNSSNWALRMLRSLDMKFKIQG